MVRRQTGLNEGGGEGAPDPNKARWIGLDCDESSVGLCKVEWMPL